MLDGDFPQKSINMVLIKPCWQEKHFWINRRVDTVIWATRVVKKIYPEVFHEDMFFTESYQNQMLIVKIWHFLKTCLLSILEDMEVSFKHIHPWVKTSLICIVSTDFKLHNLYCPCLSGVDTIYHILIE